MSATQFLLDENVDPAPHIALLMRFPEMIVWMVGDPGAPKKGTLDPDTLLWCGRLELISEMVVEPLSWRQLFGPIRSTMILYMILYDTDPSFRNLLYRFYHGKVEVVDTLLPQTLMLPAQARG